jgi:hypothetical protein
MERIEDTLSEDQFELKKNMGTREAFIAFVDIENAFN